MVRQVITVLSSVALITTSLFAHNGPKPDGQSGLVVGKPLSAIEERHAEQILDDGTREDHPSSGLFYRDERGRMRVESPSKVVIYDPVAGLIYSVDVKTKSYRKISAKSGSVVSIAVVEDGIWVAAADDPQAAKPASPVQSVSAASNERGNRPVTEDFPAKTINGLRARGTRITTIVPTGTFGNDHDVKTIQDRWYSDDLKILLKSSRSDPRFGTVTYELTNINQTAPDPSLFQVPAGFTFLGEKK